MVKRAAITRLAQYSRLRPGAESREDDCGFAREERLTGGYTAEALQLGVMR